MGDLSSQRRDYTMGGLSESDAPASPWTLFDTWYAEAADLYEPNAMVVSTIGPDSRTVLLKSYDERGLVFYTHHNSAKGQELARDPLCAVLFPWFELQRQVRFRGVATRLDQPEVDAYFSARPRDSQLGAWASLEAGGQSAQVVDRAALDAAFETVSARFPDEVPTPPSWGGYRVAVDQVEFWQGRHGRMHDRLRFTRAGNAWEVRRLAP